MTQKAKLCPSRYWAHNKQTGLGNFVLCQREEGHPDQHKYAGYHWSSEEEYRESDAPPSPPRSVCGATTERDGLLYRCVLWEGHLAKYPHHVHAMNWTETSTGTSWGDEPWNPAEVDAYEAAYRVAQEEIGAGKASWEQAKERGLYPENQDMRIAWDKGYDAAVCAYRLGHDLDDLVRIGFFVPSFDTMASVVESLLTEEGREKTRPDPRGAKEP